MAETSKSQFIPHTEKILSYRKLKDSQEWFIYYFVEEEILGVTNGQMLVYEKKMAAADKKKLLGNIAESLIHDKWASIFERRQFEMTFEENHVEMSYVTRSVVLEAKDEETRHQRLPKLISILIEQKAVVDKKYQEMSRKVQIEALTEQVSRRRHFDSFAKSKVPPKNRRKVAAPTGVQFDDDEGQDEQTVLTN